MRRFGSVVRSVSPLRGIAGVFAALVSFALLACEAAIADTVATNFDNFASCASPTPVYAACGTVNGQHGWHSAVPGDIPSLPNGYDQQVVLDSFFPGVPSAFGTKSLRVSNALNPDPNAGPLPEFHYQTYSAPNTLDAGQDLTDTVFTGSFSFISTSPGAQQAGLHISVSPDNGEGGRMSYIALDDEPGPNIQLTLYDTDPDGNFVKHDLGTVSRDQPHRITFWMKLNRGANNDLVRILIDGHDFGQCFTTWESTYNPVPVTNSLLFLSGGAGDDTSLVNGGYLFSDVTTTTSDVGGPPGCDETIDKTPDSPTVTAGGVAGYQITMHNRGRMAARELLLCDRIPRLTTFVRASVRLRRLGRRRCLPIPRLAPGKSAGFHIDLRVAAHAPTGNLDNIADILPGTLPGLPPLSSLPLPVLPSNVRAVIARAPPIATVRVLVRIIRALRSAPAPPPVTG